MKIGVLILHIRLPGCSSLKEKRGRLKPLLTSLQRQFNLSAAEVDYQDKWQDALIACAMVNNQHDQVQRVLDKVTRWVEREWRDVDLLDDQVEII